jgi:hypothetical protein
MYWVLEMVLATLCFFNSCLIDGEIWHKKTAPGDGGIQDQVDRGLEPTFVVFFF